MRTESKSSEEHLIGIRQLLTEYQPDILVVDPISALSRAGGEISPLGAAQRLMHLTKAVGITFLGTSVVDSPDAVNEETHQQISTLADTWIHLTYVVRSGERNRALTIVKSRGTGHSNQVRELVLTDKGVTLSDVYTAGGEVLMGTARWEKEEAARQEQERVRKQLQHKERELALTEAQTRTQIALLERELHTRRMELDALRADQTAREENWVASQATLRSLRGGQLLTRAQNKTGNSRKPARPKNTKAQNNKKGDKGSK
jgi:circadian clock protein KaiC